MSIVSSNPIFVTQLQATLRDAFSGVGRVTHLY